MTLLHTLHTHTLSSLPLLARGKVRDNYAVGADRLLMVASDRISAFDVVMNEAIPGKGVLLTQIALFWFDQLKTICPNHLILPADSSPDTSPESLTLIASVVTPDELPWVTGRSMLVKRLKPLPIEAVVRGYLVGSGWQEYRQTQQVCGIALPAGLPQAARLDTPLFTPAYKAPQGEHDENISFARVIDLIGLEHAQQVRDISLSLYAQAAKIALKKGLIVADTKFEFGLDENNQVTLMDEVLTPDSSRYWPADGYQVGMNPPSFDKQFLRDWLQAQPWNKQAPAPTLPQEVIEETAAKYRQTRDRLLVSPA